MCIFNTITAAILDAAEAHFHGEPEVVHLPTQLEKLATDRQYQRCDWLFAEIDMTRIDIRPVRLNVSLPSNLVQQIDTWAREHHMTRTGFLAKAAVEAMRAH